MLTPRFFDVLEDTPELGQLVSHLASHISVIIRAAAVDIISHILTPTATNLFDHETLGPKERR